MRPHPPTTALRTRHAARRVPALLSACVLLLASAAPGSASGQGYEVDPQPLPLAEGTDIESIRDLGNQAIDQAVADFLSRHRGSDLRRLAVLPLQEDIDASYFTVRFQNAFAAGGAPQGLHLYTRDQPAIAALLEEIKWGQIIGDTMDPSTIQSFGQVHGIQAVIIPRVTIGDHRGTLTVRAIIRGYEVESFRQLPGGEGKAQLLPWWQRRLGVIVGVGAALVGLVLLWLVLARLRRALRPR